MTWDELCDRADGETFGSSALSAKDEARYQIGCLIMERRGIDIENSELCECAEEEIENFLAEHPEYNNFDERGNLL